MDVPENLSWDLKNALNKRNWLAHDYFWERAVQFMTTEGRADMIEELLSIEWAEVNGLTREMLQGELGRLREEAYSPAT